MEPGNNSVKKIISDIRHELLQIYEEPEIRQLTFILFEEYLGWSKAQLHLAADELLPGPVEESILRATRELSTGKPIQYIIGKSWFSDFILKVNQYVLVPRPETEQLCTLIKSDFEGYTHQPFRILDIGTGSGAIAIDMKRHFKLSDVTAVDISSNALMTAAENALSCNCNINFRRMNIFDQLAWQNLGKFDLIVSNPPYVLDHERKLMHKNVIDFEPAQALFVPDHDPLLFYRSIAGFAVSHLETPGHLYLEINEKFSFEVCELLLSTGFGYAESLEDFHGKQRFIRARLHG